MEEGMGLLKKQARLAGLWYFLLAVAAIYGYMYVPSQLMVSGDTAATAQNMLAKEFLFRSAIVSNLFTQIIFVVLVLALYRLFQAVNGHQAKLMVGWVLVAIPISFLGDVLKFTALRIFKGDLLPSLEPERMHEMAMLFIKMSNYSGQMIAVIWGLWLFPLGLLVYRSGFIPRILGILLWLNGAGYVINSVTFILLPDYLALVSKFTMVFLFIGEIPLIFWLLIKGVKEHGGR